MTSFIEASLHPCAGGRLEIHESLPRALRDAEATMSCASRRPGSNYKAGSDRAIAVRPLFHHADISSILRPRRAHFHCKLWPLVAMTNYIFIYTQLGWTPLLRQTSRNTLRSERF